MKVPEVETFDQSLPDRREDDNQNGRDRNRHAESSNQGDGIHISRGARTLHQRRILTDNVVGRVALRSLNRDFRELAPATEREENPRSHAAAQFGQAQPVPKSLSGHDTALSILNRIQHTILATFRESHPEPSAEELARLRVDVVHGFEEGLAAARADLAGSGVLSPELEEAIRELEHSVRQGLDVLFAEPSEV